MKKDEHFMRQALAQAEKACKKGEVPVGAVLVSEDKILSRAYNQPLRWFDPTAHAEILAMRKASQKKKNYRLSHCDLFVTLEPCAMCLSAAVQARIRRLIFGAYDPKSGAVVSMMRFPLEKTNHRLEIRGGVLAEECGKVLKDFFKKKRQRKERWPSG